MFRQAFRDLGRLREIIAVARRHGFGHLLAKSGIKDQLTSGSQGESGGEPEGGARPEGAEGAPRRFRLMLQELGPTFIKLGQMLSSRPDLVPKVFVDELTLLQDRVPPEPLEHVQGEIERALGKPLAQLYAEFDPQPIASASIAQVHRAKLLSGEVVAVKVQRPSIGLRMQTDLELLRYAASLLEAVFEEGALYAPTGIVDAFAEALAKELDFENEAENIAAFTKANAGRDYLVIPAVFGTHSAKTVLTLQMLEGEKIRSIDLARHDAKLLANRIIEGSFHQLFTDGLFHGDPHPGNILVLEGERIGLLDFGMVGRLTRQMQENLILLVVAVSLRDAESVARLFYRVATTERRADLAAFTADVRELLDRYMSDETTLGSIQAQQLMPALINVAVRYRIRIPKEYALLSRAALPIEGLIRWLHPEINVIDAVMPYAKELLFGRYSNGNIGQMGMRALLRLQTFATDIPTQLSQILLDLESGKFRVQMQSEELQAINTTLKGLAVVVFLGFVACGLTIAAALSFARLDTTWHGIPVLGTLALVGATWLFLLAMSWAFASGRIRRLSLRRWLSSRKD